MNNCREILVCSRIITVLQYNLICRYWYVKYFDIIIIRGYILKFQKHKPRCRYMKLSVKVPAD